MKTKHYIVNQTIGGISFFLITLAQASTPVWTITPVSGSQTTQTVPQNTTAQIQYLVQNQSSKSKSLAMQPMQGIKQAELCQLAPKGQPSSSCILTLVITGKQLPQNGIHGGPILCQINADNSPNPNQCYQPSQQSSLNISKGPAVNASIIVTPLSLSFTAGSNGQLTVTNSLSSKVQAVNVTAKIPLVSNIFMESSNCPANLDIGASCIITLSSSIQEGPTSIAVTSENTNTVNVDVTVLSQPIISIISPIQRNRIVTVAGQTPLSLVIANDPGSVVNANNITVTNKTACPDLTVDNSDCISVAPGDTCTLQLASNTPYEPCTITIAGSNTANPSPSSAIAFFYLDGLVFETDGQGGKVVRDSSAEFSSPWTSSSAFIGSSASPTNGAGNTEAIVADSSCFNAPNECAAQQCRNIDIQQVWYLPAVDELWDVWGSLCLIQQPNNPSCKFDEFSAGTYWSSTQGDQFQSWYVSFPSGSKSHTNKPDQLGVRCIRTFTFP